MSKLEGADFFTDASLCADPYPFFEQLRSKGPVYFEPHHGVAIVTGLDEALAVCNDPTESFSACSAASGPLPPLPFAPEGDDISSQIERYRSQMPCADLLVIYDRPEHPLARGLLMHLFTPRRLKENEAYLYGLVDRMVGQILVRRTVEVVSELGSPYATLVITDLLGVPEEDRDTYRDRLTAVPAPIGEAQSESFAQHPLEFLHESFTAYIEERRNAPRNDVLTLLATTLRMLAERSDIQQRLRDEPRKIPNFIEEVLRLEGPIKATFRLTRKTTKIGDMVVKAGTVVMIAIPTVNRNPSLYETPDSIRMDRPKLREHLAFGRGKHTARVHHWLGSRCARCSSGCSLERPASRSQRHIMAFKGFAASSMRRPISSGV